MTYDLGVIGAGIMGASAALAAARGGMDVVLVDQGHVPNPRAASSDHSKVFRHAYGDPLYIRLARRAETLWRELERDSGRELLTTTGLVLLGQGDAAAERFCVQLLQQEGCAATLLDARDVVDRYPQFAASAFAAAAFDPSGAIAHAARAVAATVDLARRRGVTVVEGKRVCGVDASGFTTADGARIACARTLVAGGPWAPRLLGDLVPLQITRQDVLYFEPRRPEDFLPERFPIFLEPISGFYGFPVHHGRAMKIANHHKGPVTDPDDAATPVADEASCRAFFARFLPDLADARLVETKVCFYDNTPDDDFVIDRHPELPNVVLASGFSGHGFKFGPAIGEIAAEMLATGRSTFPVERFALRRLRRAEA